MTSMMPPSMMPPTFAEVRAIVPATADTDDVEVEELLWGPISPAVAREAVVRDSRRAVFSSNLA
jgi:hypothetical protein